MEEGTSPLGLLKFILSDFQEAKSTRPQPVLLAPFSEDNDIVFDIISTISKTLKTVD